MDYEPENGKRPVPRPLSNSCGETQGTHSCAAPAARNNAGEKSNARYMARVARVHYFLCALSSQSVVVGESSRFWLTWGWGLVLLRVSLCLSFAIIAEGVNDHALQLKSSNRRLRRRTKRRHRRGTAAASEPLPLLLPRRSGCPPLPPRGR